MTMTPVGIRLDGVSKRFKGGVDAISDVTLDVEPGEFMVLVGPSGCGKSTLLRIVAGLEEVSAGRVHIGDDDVTTHLPQERDVAMVFQSYALYPRMSVRRNMGFGLRMRRTDKAERERRVNEVAEVLALEHLLDRRPGALSGGQRQRVAMGRAIVREPRVFLMDEPLSNLDAKLRVSMRAQLSLLHQRLGVTTVYVTHDQVEAMTLGQRVAVLRDGRLQQCDTPQRLYRHPVNLFVAAFIGSPSMNLVEAELGDDAVEFAGLRLPLSPARRPDSFTGRTVILGIRPQDFDDARAAQDSLPALEVEAAVVEELGSATHVLFTIDAPAVDVDSVRAATDEGERATLLATDRRALFTAELPEGTSVRPGDRIRLALDHTRLHFFDPATGDSLRSGALAATA
jgi:multiple sugar transport system ATP-binding protein